jgi:hypothetical protein
MRHVPETRIARRSERVPEPRAAFGEALPCPLPQSPEFGRALVALGATVARHETGGVTWQAVLRRVGPLRVSVLSRGPVGAAQDRLDWLAAVGRHQPGPLLLEAETLPPEALRAAGFWPLMTPASLAVLPLQAPEAMRAAMAQKWRNRLNRTTGAGLTITRRPPGRDDWLLAAEAAQARARGYRALPPAFAAAYAQVNPGRALVWEARHAGKPVAAILVLRHGAMATWQTGHATPEGRRLNAMNALLWEAMTWLHARGHTALDLGIVNTDDAPGIARFKLGTGARLHRLSGSWLRMGALAPVARCLPLRLAA